MQDSDKIRACSSNCAYFNCDVCKLCFSSATERSSHQCNNNEDRPIFTVQEAIMDHVKRTNIGTIVSTVENPLRCDSCNQCFNHNDMENHKKMHFGSKPLVCIHCNLTFSSRTHYNSHLRLNCYSDRYRCEICKTTFDAIYRLRVHQLKYSAKMPYECEQCNKAYQNHETFVSHQSECSKRSVKLYRCLICGERFHFVSNFIKHQMICYDGQSFSCEACLTAFSTKNDLETHLCQENKLIKCPHCDLLFTNWSLFLKHQGSH